jgi:anti-sigma-K factor RskA
MARGVALAAALALVVGLGVWNVDLRNDRAEAQAFAARQAEVLDELNDRGIYHVAPLETSDGQAVGMVVVHDGAAKVMADGLPVNDAERETLVLWGMRSQLSPVALGTFDVVHSELDVRTVSSTSTVLDAYDGYAISLEPGRRAPSTPTDTIATGTVGS